MTPTARWLFALCFLAGCNRRNDEDGANELISRELAAEASLPRPPTPEPKPAGQSQSDERIRSVAAALVAADPPGAGPTTVSGESPRPPELTPVQRLDFAAEKWAGRGRVAAFSQVRPAGSGDGRLWLVVGENDPVALTGEDAFNPVPVAVTDAAVEFLAMPGSDSVVSSPAEMQAIRLMSVSVKGGEVIELATLGGSDTFETVGNWRYVAIGGGHSTSAQAGRIEAWGPDQVVKEVRALRRDTITDFAVLGPRLFWVSAGQPSKVLDHQPGHVWSTLLTEDGGPTGVIKEPVYSSENQPSLLAVLGEQLFVLTVGTLDGVHRDGSLARWNAETSSLDVLVKGVRLPTWLVATSDALCWDRGAPRKRITCYRPATDQLIEMSQGRDDWNLLSTAAPFGDGLIWSEDAMGGGSGRTYVAVP